MRPFSASYPQLVSIAPFRSMIATSKIFIPRITLFAFLVGLVLSLPAVAQQPGPSPEQREERMQAHVDSIAAHLDLSNDQKAAVKPILLESMKKRIKRLLQFRDQTEDKRRRAKRRAARSLRDDLEAIDETTDDQLEEHLSNEQMKTYLEYREKQREEMREALRNRRGG